MLRLMFNCSEEQAKAKFFCPFNCKMYRRKIVGSEIVNVDL